MIEPRTGPIPGGGGRMPGRRACASLAVLASLFLVSAAGAQEIRGSMEPLPGADDDFAPFALGNAPDSAFPDDPADLAEEPLVEPPDGAPPPLADPEEKLRRKKKIAEDNPFEPV